MNSNMYMYRCYSCDQQLSDTPSCGMNLGFGVFEWCSECCPAPDNVADLIEQIDMAINPPKGDVGLHLRH